MIKSERMEGSNIIITTTIIAATTLLLQGRNQTTITMRVTLMTAESRKMVISNPSISRGIQRVNNFFIN